MRPGEAEIRVARILYVSLALAAVVYSLLGLSKALGQLEVQRPWLGWGAYAVDTAAPIILGALALRAPLGLLRGLALGYAGVFALTFVVWRFAMLTTTEPGAASPWPNDVISIGVVAVAIATTPRRTWVYLGVLTLLSGIVRYVADPELGVGLAVMDMLYALLTNVVFAALALVSLRGAQRLDVAADRAREQAAAEAAATARVQERVRIDALAHDHVLSALLIASRRDAVPRDKLRELARMSLSALEETVGSRNDAVPGHDLVSMLRSAVTSQSDGIDFTMHLDGSPDVPVDIAHALLEATGEALRNSLRHAERGGSPVTRSVTVAVAQGSASIDVVDDGVGFQLRRIPVERLGVRVSILDRMSAVEGGHAEIRSSPGSGTRVRLAWSAP